jgi:hypothetical protein
MSKINDNGVVRDMTPAEQVQYDTDCTSVITALDPKETAITAIEAATTLTALRAAMLAYISAT